MDGRESAWYAPSPLFAKGKAAMFGGGAGQKGVMSIVYATIVFAIVLVFIVQFRPGSGQRSASLSRQCVATIRDRCIEPKEFSAALGLVVPRGLDEQIVRGRRIRRTVIDGLVERSLLVQDAQRLGITVSDDEVNADLVKGWFRVSLPVSRADLASYLGMMPREMTRVLTVTHPNTKKFDYKTYKQVVRSFTNRSPSEFKEMQREEAIAARMRAIVRARARVADVEAFEQYKLDKSTAALSYVALHQPYFEKNFVDTSARAATAWRKEHAEQVKKAYEERKKDFPPGCRKIRHILVGVKSDQRPSGHERSEAQSMIEKARERVAKGESFATVASEITEDTVSKAKGGDLGCVVRGKWPKPFEDAVWALKDPGALSEVIETDYGFHVVQLDLVVPENEAQATKQIEEVVARDLMISTQGEAITSATAKRILESALAGKSLEDALSEALAQLEEQTGRKPATAPDTAAQAEPSDLDDVTSPTARPVVSTTPEFTAQSAPLRGVAPGQNVAAIAFSLDKPGALAKDLVRLTDGFAVVQLKERSVATREQYGAERNEFLPPMVEAKAEYLLLDYLARLREQAKDEIRVDETWAKEPEKKEE